MLPLGAPLAKSLNVSIKQKRNIAVNKTAAMRDNLKFGPFLSVSLVLNIIINNYEHIPIPLNIAIIPINPQTIALTLPPPS